MNQRKEYIDVAKGMTIFLVVFTHAPMFLNTTEQMRGIIRWVGAFHMPLFFFIYGVIHNGENFRLGRKKECWISFFEKKFRGLLIPYLVWAWFYGKLNIASLPMVLWGTNISLGYAESNGVLWFLPTMFLSSILYQLYIEIYYLVDKFKHIFTIIIVIACYFIAEKFMDIWTPWCHIGGIDIAFTCVIFMITGMYILKLIEKISIHKTLLFLITTIIFVITFYISKANGDESVGGYIFVYARYGKNYLVYLVNGILMCLGMVLLAILLEKLKYLSWLGKYSLAIMVLHYFVFEITTPMFSGIVKYYAIFATLINSILTIIVCVPLIMLLNKYLPETIGKK